MRKNARKPSANSIEVVNTSLPRHIVASQLKNLIPVGTPIAPVRKLKNGRYTRPVANMWCAQTPNDRSPIPIVAPTNAL